MSIVVLLQYQYEVIIVISIVSSHDRYNMIQRNYWGIRNGIGLVRENLKSGQPLDFLHVFTIKLLGGSGLNLHIIQFDENPWVSLWVSIG